MTNLLPLDDFLDLITRMVIVFGLAFELPLLLIAAEHDRGRHRPPDAAAGGAAWSSGITVFAAVATPTGDPLDMLACSRPDRGACTSSPSASRLLNDKRRNRKNPDARLGDDEASELDLTPEPVGGIEPVGAPRAQRCRSRVRTWTAPDAPARRLRRRHLTL